jgi:hypothetical protein
MNDKKINLIDLADSKLKKRNLLKVIIKESQLIVLVDSIKNDLEIEKGKR